jgi:amino acid permease
MYQPNIPAIYHEMKEKSMFKMKKVLGIGTAIASLSYCLTGIFGYVTFVKHPDVDLIMNK